MNCPNCNSKELRFTVDSMTHYHVVNGTIGPKDDTTLLDSRWLECHACHTTSLDNKEMSAMQDQLKGECA